MTNFTFINHASYLIETENSLLIVDPWVEGGAFDNGWALLDKSITNSKLVEHLNGFQKKIFIWISHEHSDHFSVAFLKMLKKKNVTVKFIFQKTLDGRVSKFITKLGFQIIESNDTLEIIDTELSIITFPYAGGDSYSLTILKDFSILNINDCDVSDRKGANSVIFNLKKYTNKVDLLLTQFGYANWVGNVNDKYLREEFAQKKLSTISLQVKNFSPTAVIPFASFIYFSHNENFHTNDSQNTPRDVQRLFKKDKVLDKLIVLKPWDKLDLNQNLVQDQTVRTSNIKYWDNLFKKIKPNDLFESQFSIDEIEKEYKAFRKKIFKSFLFAPSLLEIMGFISPIKFYLKDQNLNLDLSYCSKIRIQKGNKSVCDMSLSSATLNFILQNEYGANTTHVNGKFERVSKHGVQIFLRFFSPQEYMKMGYGLNHPFTTISIVIGKLFHKMKSKNWDINPSNELK